MALRMRPPVGDVLDHLDPSHRGLRSGQAWHRSPPGKLDHRMSTAPSVAEVQCFRRADTKGD